MSRIDFLNPLCCPSQCTLLFVSTCACSLHVRARDQILSDGFDERTSSSFDWSLAGQEMHPLEWHRRLNASDQEVQPVVLDCRNSYESEVGVFDGAVPLNTTFFRESWPVLEDVLKDTPKDAPIMTYCTGGIRCVKVGRVGLVHWT